MTQKKKISVIVPIYKGTVYIPALIRMIQNNQKSLNSMDKVEIELVLVNDYPEEEITAEQQLLRGIACIRIINEGNRGIHFSRVNGFLHSTGNYILFLDQDDEISPIYLREQLKILDDYDAVICNGKNRGDLIYRNAMEFSKAIDIDQYKKGYNQVVSPGQVLLKREAIPTEWLENILLNNGADDYFLWMLMFWKKCKIRIQEKVLYWHVISDKNASSNFDMMDCSVIEMVDNMVRLGGLTYKEGIEIKRTRAIYSKRAGITKERYEKEYKYREILEMWMTLRDKNISLDKYLEKRGFYRVVIYGAGFLGKHLYCELQKSHIQIKCFLDRNTGAEIPGIDTLTPDAQLESVDVVIVTPFIEYVKIKKELQNYTSYPIISLETILLNADFELDTE